MNNYYASVESLYDPNLRKVPMAVCGDPAMRHGIILAKNDLAKKRGIVTGESIYAAKQKVPNLTTITADHRKYVKYAKLAREIYSQYSDDVIHFGLDESWVVLTGRVNNIEVGRRTADDIRMRIKSELGLTVSVGVSWNFVFSKLASDMRKPDATTVLSRNDLRTVIWNLPAFELLFVGKATRKKLTESNILTIGDLAQSDIRFVRKLLGKNGETLWFFANGNDCGFDPRTPADNPFKSIGNTITMPYDLHDELDILTMLYVLSGTVSSRLKKHSLKAGCVSILIKYSDFKTINRQLTVAVPVNDERSLYVNARQLFRANFDRRAVRSVGIHVSKLDKNMYEQLSLFDKEPVPIDEVCDIERNLRGKLKAMRVEKYFGFTEDIAN
ncbi:MAG: DNA polymerase IV [Oscillospiraceae bacterium]|nr:DNA polymerase IV [Oscillospiraceae bacterium]